MDVSFNLPFSFNYQIDDQGNQKSIDDYPAMISLLDDRSGEMYAQRFNYSDIIGRKMNLRFCDSKILQN